MSSICKETGDFAVVVLGPTHITIIYYYMHRRPQEPIYDMYFIYTVVGY